MWRLWAKALGEKSSPNKAEADKIALIRTCIVMINTLCCVFIMAGIVHHW